MMNTTLSVGDLCEVLRAVVIWTVDAAKDHMAYSAHSGETPDPEGSMGLWESFRAEFPADRFPGVYDVLINVYMTTYSQTVTALTDATLVHA